MSFSTKDVKRSIRDFDLHTQTLLNGELQTYQSRVNQFIQYIQRNHIIYSIVQPLMEKKLDFNEIMPRNLSGWIDLKLPSTFDDQLAFVLQIMRKSSENEFAMESFAAEIFVEKSYNNNIRRFNTQVVSPCLQQLLYKLNDLIEDEVEGKEIVSPAALQIFNYGTITAREGGNVAIGQQITQTSNYTNIVEGVLKEAKEQGLITSENEQEVQGILEEVQNELENQQPEKGKLKTLCDKLYDVGKAGLVKITTDVINNPQWGQIVTDLLFSKLS
ncbi:hypothetical protein COF67_27320 [Bacillus toyonensis]|uniref:hypothetical protein n=1 Tax=Bacillus toyonensis TaxID=155322 RepID=UPI000BFBD213|nr:hypothetical protein [Bacillus toyonensis]PHD43191.1 hypothetical protein COF67_27320 [Bacillus toyonensis]